MQDCLTLWDLVTILFCWVLNVDLSQRLCLGGSSPEYPRHQPQHLENYLGPNNDV